MLTLAALLSLSATASAQSTTDYDSDDDGYIDVKTHQQLNAIRYDLNGNGAQDSVGATDWAKYTAAFPSPATGMGCKLTDHDSNSQTAEQPTCVGYELTASLDFDSDSDGDVDANDHSGNYWNSGDGWIPIGLDSANRYTANFKGNRHTINNLFINKNDSYRALFGRVDSGARIETLGITNANITGGTVAAILVGRLYGTSAIVACYTTGKVAGGAHVGGLVGFYSNGTISTSYSTAYVSGSSNVGGLLGYRNNGSVTNSYATGRVARSSGTATTIGGLIGDSRSGASGAISNSYYDTSTSGCVTGGSDGCTTSAGGSGVVGKTTRQLQTPTGYTGIYANWNTNLDGDTSTGEPTTGNDNPWAFGNKMQYPMLDYDGMSTDPQGGLAMGIPDNWNAPIVGERVGVCLATPANRATFTVSGQTRKRAWIWEKSTNGDTWEAITGTNPPTYEYAPTTDDVGSYLRAKVQLSGGGFAYTRNLGGRVKNASAATAGTAISFVSGNTSPRVGQKIQASDPRPTGAVDARFSWQRCDNSDTTYTDCEYIYGVWWTNYTPTSADLNHYLRMIVYYETSGGVWTRHASAFTGQVAAASQ